MGGDSVAGLLTYNQGSVNAGRKVHIASASISALEPSRTAAKAQEHPGSWWPDWLEWVKAQDPAEVPARQPGNDKYKPFEDAPGSYVRVRS